MQSQIEDDGMNRSNNLDRDEDVIALKKNFHSSNFLFFEYLDQITVQISPSELLSVSNFLLKERNFKQLSFLAGVDCLELNLEYRFKVVYSLLDFERSKRIRLEVICEYDLMPSLPSVCSVWTGANYHESEAFDLVGIQFEGHPNLERIFTPEGFEGFPHRKDFDVSSETVEFSFRPTPDGKPSAKE